MATLSGKYARCVQPGQDNLLNYRLSPFNICVVQRSNDDSTAFYKLCDKNEQILVVKNSPAKFVDRIRRFGGSAKSGCRGDF